MSDDFQTVSRTMKRRRTAKVIGDVEKPLMVGNLPQSRIDSMLEAAGWAPFHYPVHQTYRADDATAIEPWRAYKLDAEACRQMIRKIDADDNPGIITGMLAAADALINVTWLPDPASAPEGALEASDRNVEHIAAASAFIQNLLLAATAQGITTYWSSGGIFRKEKYLSLLGAGKGEQLLGSVFLFPEDIASCEVRPGKLRENRSGPNSWSSWVKL